MRTVWMTVVLAGLLSGFPGVGLADEATLETAREQERTLAAERAVAKVGSKAPDAILPESAEVNGSVQFPLFVGLDDATLLTYQIDPVADTANPLFDGIEVWGAAFDPSGNRVYTSDGADLYEWFVGNPSPTLIGTITDSTATNVTMEGLAFYDGTLYASKVVSSGDGEGIYVVDPATLTATRVITYVDSGLTTISGIDADPDTGQIYGTNDNSALRGLVSIDMDGTVSLVAAYPGDETDVDGLAVGGGKAYLITDDQTPPTWDVYDFAAASYTDTVTSPFTTTEIFAGGAFIFDPTPAPKLSCEGFQFPMASAVTVKRYNSYPPYFDQPSVLPLTMRLLDDSGEAVYPQDLSSLPVVEVLFDGYETESVNGYAMQSPVPQELPFVGFGNDGNRFEFDQGFWRFYMGTGAFGATGTYYVAVISGDETEYRVDPTCVGTFTIVNPFSFGW